MCVTVFWHLGHTKEGQTKEGQTKEGQTKEGQTKEGQTKEGQPVASTQKIQTVMCDEWNKSTLPKCTLKEKPDRFNFKPNADYESYQTPVTKS